MTFSDTLTPAPQGHAEACDAARPATLDLPLPADLPASLVPPPAEAALLAGVLDDFLTLLAPPAGPGRAAQCRAMLARLGEGAIRPARTGATAIPASTAEVEDFDRYFQVRRVGPDAPALTLLRALLQGAAGVFSLAERADLPAAHLARLETGMAAHALLLARMGLRDAAR